MCVGGAHKKDIVCSFGLRIHVYFVFLLFSCRCVKSFCAQSRKKSPSLSNVHRQQKFARTKHQYMHHQYPLAVLWFARRTALHGQAAESPAPGQAQPAEAPIQALGDADFINNWSMCLRPTETDMIFWWFVFEGTVGSCGNWMISDVSLKSGSAPRRKIESIWIYLVLSRRKKWYTRVWWPVLGQGNLGVKTMMLHELLRLDESRAPT